MAHRNPGPDPAEPQLPLGEASHPADQPPGRPQPAASEQPTGDEPRVATPQDEALSPSPAAAAAACEAPASPGDAVAAEPPPDPPTSQRPAGPPPRNGGRSGLRLGTGAGARVMPGSRNPAPRAGAGGRGPLTLARSNLQALEVLARLDPGGQPLHPGQRAALEQWAGWGPMAKAFDPHERTSAWQQLGARLRELLTPEEGTAAQQATATSFYTAPAVTAATPAGLPVSWTGVERDPVSARIASRLHPHARIITAPLERVSLPPASFAAACGNVPFADVTPYDPCAPKKLSLHNYFIWRAVRAVHPGGLVAVVTSRFTLDSQEP